MTDVAAAVTRPIPGPAPHLMPLGFDLGAHGYVEEEHLLEGTATSYRFVGEHGPDGRWTAEPAGTAPYRTRLLVRRPTDPARFSGTVVVEWLNVSAGIDAAPDWGYIHRHLLRRGDAWVGVSAQKAGIDGGGFVTGFHLKQTAPDRYDVLEHPGDRFAFDIFTTVARLVRGSSSPLDGLVPTQVLAVGESQSAMYLTTYINAIDALVQAYDGFLVHGRGVAGAPIDVDGATTREHIGSSIASTTSVGDQIRADARVPVLVLQSETDLVVLGSGRARQPDGDRVRLWEVAGAAHADTYLLGGGNADDGTLPPEKLAHMLRPLTELFGMPTGRPINAGPQQHYVAQAACSWLQGWAAGGPPPPTAPLLALNAAGDDFVRDADGIATGGLRTPWVDVPLLVLSGLGQSGEGFAFLFGTSESLDVAARYPGGRDEYLARLAVALDATIAAGYVLADDREEIVALSAATYDLLTA